MREQATFEFSNEEAELTIKYLEDLIPRIHEISGGTKDPGTTKKYADSLIKIIKENNVIEDSANIYNDFFEPDPNFSKKVNMGFKKLKEYIYKDFRQQNKFKQYEIEEGRYLIKIKRKDFNLELESSTHFFRLIFRLFPGIYFKPNELYFKTNHIATYVLIVVLYIFLYTFIYNLYLMFGATPAKEGFATQYSEMKSIGSLIIRFPEIATALSFLFGCFLVAYITSWINNKCLKQKTNPLTLFSVNSMFLVLLYIIYLCFEEILGNWVLDSDLRFVFFQFVFVFFLVKYYFVTKEIVGCGFQDAFFIIFTQLVVMRLIDVFVLIVRKTLLM